MIPLDRIKACSNPVCRLVLPADPDDEPSAGFWVAKREGGVGSRVLRWQSWCKDCTRVRSRHDNGIRRRGHPYAPRVPQDKEARVRYLAERLVMLEERHLKRMADPKYAARHRAKERERARQRRRQAGIYPRRSDDPKERLPAEPLRAFFDAVGLPTTQIAERLGVCESRVGHLRRGYYYHKTKRYGMRRYQVRSVSFSLALRVAQAFDVAMGEIWPDVYGA